jgi:hypothetical protein
VVTLSSVTVPSANSVTGESVTGESVTSSAVRGALDVRVGTTLAFVVKTLVSDTVVHSTSTPKVSVRKSS